MATVAKFGTEVSALPQSLPVVDQWGNEVTLRVYKDRVVVEVTPPEEDEKKSSKTK